MFSLDKITSLQDTWLLIGSNAIHLIKGRWNPLIIELVPYMQSVIRHYPNSLLIIWTLLGKKQEPAG